MLTKWLSNITTAIISFLVFFYAIQLPSSNDIKEHIHTIIQISTGNIALPGHFLYFLLISILSGFSSSFKMVSVVACTVLAFFIIIKKLLTEKIISEIIKNTEPFPLKKNIYSLLPIIGTLFIFFTNLPSKPPFKLPWPPITWINSTLVFVFPLSMILFKISFDTIKNTNKKNIIQLILTGLLVLISKPNYLLIITIALPLFGWFTNKDRQKFLCLSLISLFFILLIYIQYYYIYSIYLSNIPTTSYKEINTIFAPFKAWGRISRNIPLSFLLWFAFPLSVFLMYGKKLISETLYTYATFTFIIGLLIFISLEEVSSNNIAYGSVNFSWQLFISLYLLSVISFAYQLKYIIERKKILPKDHVLFLIFFYYALSGILYLYNTVFKFFIL